MCEADFLLTADSFFSATATSAKATIIIQENSLHKHFVMYSREPNALFQLAAMSLIAHVDEALSLRPYH